MRGLPAQRDHQTTRRARVELQSSNAGYHRLVHGTSSGESVTLFSHGLQQILCQKPGKIERELAKKEGWGGALYLSRCYLFFTQVGHSGYNDLPSIGHACGVRPGPGGRKKVEPFAENGV